MNTWNFNTGLRRLRTSRNCISNKNEASMRHFGSCHVRNFLAKIANLCKKLLSIRTALRKEGKSDMLKSLVAADR